MATIAPTPLFILGNVACYTKEVAETDDTNLFALGNIYSILDYGISPYVIAVTPDDRILVINSEIRTMPINEENRILVINSEIRTMPING